jgi:hypothetical protein
VGINEYRRGLYVSRAAQRLNGYRQYNMGVVVVLMEVLIYWLTKRDGKRQTRKFIGQIRELIHRPLGQHGAGCWKTSPQQYHVMRLGENLLAGI